MVKVIFGIEVIKKYSEMEERLDNPDLLGTNLMVKVDGKCYRFDCEPLDYLPLKELARQMVKGGEEGVILRELPKEDQGLFTPFHTEEVEE